MHVRSSSRDETGFGLVELLVVVLIVGVLAALAAPIFLRQAESASDAAARSDLGNSRSAFIANVTLGRETTEKNLRDFGRTLSTGTSSFEIYISESELDGENSDWWCIQETSATGLTFHVKAEPGIHDGSCDIAYYTSPFYVDGEVT
jgi:type IV pilus assembly protein PilA